MSENEEDTSANIISLENSLAVKGSDERVKSDSELQKKRRYFCKICDVGFSTFPPLRHHLSASHTVKITSKSYFCQACEKSFPYLPTFQIHLHREHTVEKIDACVKCHFQLPHARAIPTRLSGDAYSEHYCVVCQAEMKANKRRDKEDAKARSDGKKKTPPGRDAGSQVRGLEKKFFCEVCHTRYATSCNLSNHLLTKHGVINQEDRPHRCDFCQRGFVSLGRLKIHRQREHVETKPHACVACDERFASEKQLQRHSLRHHPSKERCDVCLKEISSSYIRVHMRNHSGIKPHACAACGKRFPTSGSMRTHLVTHTGEKPYTCETCGNGFGRREHLKTHVRVHTGERPYVCDVCQRGFTQKWVMVAHRRIHTGERPFECEVCQRGFIYNRQLKLHLLSHCKDGSSN